MASYETLVLAFGLGVPGIMLVGLLCCICEEACEEALASEISLPFWNRNTRQYNTREENSHQVSLSVISSLDLSSRVIIVPPHGLALDQMGHQYTTNCIDEAQPAMMGYDGPGRSKNTVTGLDQSAAPIGERMWEECSICLQKYSPGDVVRRVPCPHPHAFHVECIDTWLQIKAQCPLCKTPFS